MPDASMAALVTEKYAGMICEWPERAVRMPVLPRSSTADREIFKTGGGGKKREFEANPLFLNLMRDRSRDGSEL